jgi:PAS domain S-box-containing protein
MLKPDDNTSMAALNLAEILNDHSIDRVMAIDRADRIMAWNRTAEQVTGISKQDIQGKKLLEIFPQFAQDRELMQALELAHAGMKSFVPAHKDLFNRHHYENHFIPLKGPDNEVVGVMNIMHDVAHRIKAEQELYRLNIALKKKYEQLERTSDELAALTHITTHNIKEPLRQVYAAIELLIRAEAKALSDGGRANLRRTQASLNRMSLLLDDIVALSRINSQDEEDHLTDLNPVLQQAIQKLDDKIRSANIHIEVAALPAVQGHRDMLYYLFYYLLTNAFKLRKHNTALHIHITGQQVTLPAHEEGAPGKIYTKLSFTDNGTGFDPQDAARLFLITDKDPQKYASSGAGLAICRKIMMAHNGFIEAEGWPGIGAAFHCYFPHTVEE